jgi:hypothetical protein
MEAMPQIFLSYAREDKEKVEDLYQKLSDAGLKPWMDVKDILPGEIWESAIENAVRDSDFFLACISTHSVSKRGFLRKETRDALDIWQKKLASDIYLIPVRLEHCKVPESLRAFQWVDLFEEDGWTRLEKAIHEGMKRRAEEIKPIIEKPGPPVTAQPATPIRPAARSMPEPLLPDNASKKGEEKEAKSFWITLPGILTGIAAVITAIGTLFMALSTAGLFKPMPTATVVTTIALATPASATLTPADTPTQLLDTPTPRPPAPTDTPTNTTTPPPTATPTGTPTPTPTDTPLPPPSPSPTPTPKQPTPTPSPYFGGQLAIPVKFGYQSKVYVTGLDGQGINGPDSVSLDARQPMFSHDGQLLIFNGQIEGHLGVFVADGQGQAPRLLVNADSACWPTLSPDGSEVIFSEKSLGCKLQKRTGDGTILEITVNNRPIIGKNVLWTEQNQIVFQGCATWIDQSSKCGIWVTDANHINPARLVVGEYGRPMDAKDGKLVYMSDEDKDWDIYLISLSGGAPQNLTNNSGIQDGLAAIAPDGQSVAYISNQSGKWGLWTVSLRSLEKRWWFDIGSQQGTIDVNEWAGDRMSWGE